MKFISESLPVGRAYWACQRKILIFLSLFLFAALPFPTHARCSAYIVVPDKLAFPEDRLFIEAHLYRGGLLKILQMGISGELLRFYNPAGELLTTVLTDRSGFSRIPFSPNSPCTPGIYPVSVRLAKNSRFSAEPETGHLFIRHKNKPLFFSMIEGVLRTEQFSSFPLQETEPVAPRPDSATALTRISPYYTLVYLSMTSQSSLDKTRQWLTGHKFPLAPLYLLDHSIEGSLSKNLLKETPKLKTDIIESLWRNRSLPAFLVTSNPDFAKSASEKNIKVYLLSAEKESGSSVDPTTGDIARITPVQDWAEILSYCTDKSRAKNKSKTPRESQ